MFLCNFPVRGGVALNVNFLYVTERDLRKVAKVVTVVKLPRPRKEPMFSLQNQKPIR